MSEALSLPAQGPRGALANHAGSRALSACPTCWSMLVHPPPRWVCRCDRGCRLHFGPRWPRCLTGRAKKLGQEAYSFVQTVLLVDSFLSPWKHTLATATCWGSPLAGVSGGRAVCSLPVRFR